ncbi:aminopeptidase I zinc metalloprotease (M18) [Clostridiales bacterium 1_7_47FAA]|uniref:M18 family aminopeptidase n=1 Tax=Enterocloster hominis (ex Hitch et al. 2024) TaxID=1917870 RepID=A0ABV1D2Q2_9FIRM|nr:aminopeptidase I zinc metalloprotease (M18) [Clostridiales bacterium 1_7_47FAA]
MSKKTKAQELQEQLTWTFPHIGKDSPEQIEKASKYCEGYKEFLNAGKTERECVKAAVKMLKKAGYRPFDRNASYEPGDKVYYVNRGKALIATTFGKKPLTEGVRINGAHIDSPRLDLKPNPLYEKDEIAFFKTHYYGGIRKYQWGTIPLAIHGVVVKKNGETVDICIGEDETDPVFCVTDLLPHLSAKQNERPLKDGLKGEELNIVIGSLPYQEEDIKEPVKLMALSLLNERYKITEKDFFRAELELVPAVKARDVGLDASMIGAYGQDDRVCAYTALTAEMDAKKPAHTTVTILTDKEETGSDGNTGLNSDYVLHYIEDLAGQAGVPVRDVLRNSLCLSSDVNAAYDPTFPDVYEGRNSSYINKGCVLTKYTGARGKSGSNDASAETMAKVIGIMEEEGVYWQAGELGAVDAGGGGTIAKLVAHMNVDTVDLGVPILSMHSPFELSSKLDVYNTYKAFKAFYK